VAILVADGLTDREIASRLFVSERTAEGHVQHIRDKLGFDNRTQIASWVAGQGLTAMESSPTSWRHNLPGQLTRFIGRERELAEVRRLVRRARLVTITGPGGCGKTRLAIQAAADVLHLYPDGAWFADLCSITDPALVPQAIAIVLKVREREEADLLETIAAELTTNYCRLRCLVIVDNCEHLIDRCASVVTALLSACPQLTVLVTSREVLQVTGEAVCKIEPLGLPDPGGDMSAESVRTAEAVQLFVDRAGLTDPGFELDDQNAATVARVCQRLDGIPLALELAAARVGLMPLDALLERLEDRFSLLWQRATPSRQQTLRSAIGWSYELLTDGERRLFRRLAAFSGGFTLEAAEVVCIIYAEPAGDLFPTMAALVNKSLVIRAHPGLERYRLLETVRQYALEKLAQSGELDLVRQRHLEFFMALADQAGPGLAGPDQGSWLEQLSQEHDNLRAALETSLAAEGELRLRLVLALERFWQLRGYVSEGVRWFDQALSGPAEATLLRARALNSAAGLSWLRGDLDHARAQLEASLVIRRHIDDQAGIQGCLANLGVLASTQTDWASASGYFEESLVLAQRLGNELAMGILLGNLGLLAAYLDDHDVALRRLVDSLDIMRRVGDTARVANAHANLGLLALYRARVDDATTHYTSGLRLLQTIGEPHTVAECLEGFATISAREGRHVRAIRLAASAAALRKAAEAPPRPWSRRLMDEWLTDARAALGATSDVDWAEGQAMTVANAVSFALEEELSHFPPDSR
jgi:predicted ATPase